MTLLREIQADVSQGTTDLLSVLRKCKILAARLKSPELSRWTQSELDGYPASESVPEYRRLHTTLYGTFMNMAWSARKQVVPFSMLPKEHRDIERMQFRPGIAQAIAFAGKGATVHLPELTPFLRNNVLSEMECYHAWLEISGTEFDQLVSAVRTRILDFALDIEAENPAAGEAAPGAEPIAPSRVQQIVQNFFGPVGNVAQHSEHFSQTAAVGTSAAEELADLVGKFRAHIDELGLDGRSKQRAGAQLSLIETELQGDVDGSVVSQAGRTLRNITEGAIGSLLATAAQPGVWAAIHGWLAKF